MVLFSILKPSRVRQSHIIKAKIFVSCLNIVFAFAHAVPSALNCFHPSAPGEHQLISENSVAIFRLLLKAICISNFLLKNFFYIFHAHTFTFPLF